MVVLIFIIQYHKGEIMFYKDDKLYTESEIKALYPNTSFPKPFNPNELGYTVVFDTPKPEVGELEIAYQDGTEIDSKGNRVIKWLVKDMFEDYTNEEGEVVTKVEQEAKYIYDKAKALVPKTITPRQIRLILLKNELLDDIELIIQSNREIQIWWEYSLEIERNNPQLLEFAEIAKLTDEQLDDLFIEGSIL